MKIGGDFTKLAALEARYHKTCHASYIKHNTNTKKQNDLALCDNAFINFDNEYFNPLITSGRAVNMQTLLQKYQEQLIINGISMSDTEKCRAEELKTCLTSKDGSSLIFASQKNPAAPQIVYSDIDIVDVINTAYKHKKILSCNDTEQELSDISSNTSSNPYIVLHQTTLILKEVLQSSTGIETTTLNPYDITFEKAKDVVSNIVTKFLEFFIGKANKSITRILSIAQDLIFVTSNDRIKTPKHAGLAFSMKNDLRAKTHISSFKLSWCLY